MTEPYELHNGDCLEVLRTMPDNSIDAVVTDPPYGLAFMGKRWDYDVPSEEIWLECLRVLKPGGHLLAFAGTRTQHRMAVRIEDAGFEIRDMIAWVYGSGFPKSLDVSKAIDKAAGADGEWYEHPQYASRNGNGTNSIYGQTDGRNGKRHLYAPATPAAQQWHGWGTALKPALEPITVARKPLIGTVAENVLAHGTGGINVGGCRVGTDTVGWEGKGRNSDSATAGASRGGTQGGYNYTGGEARPVQGRWPANLIHDGSEEVVGAFPETRARGNVLPTKRRQSGGAWAANGSAFGIGPDGLIDSGDSGSAARFFYCAKASKADRGDGNNHPTVKPTDLMRYLCRLVTPPGGVVLDPFMGSGSTGKAAMLEGFRFVGIEREAEYLQIARARIQHAVDNLDKQQRLL